MKPALTCWPLYALLLGHCATRPATSIELAQATGVYRNTVRMVMRRLYDAGIVHIAEWHSAPGSMPAARWKFGAGIDATLPLTKAGEPSKRQRTVVQAKPRAQITAFVSIMRLLESGPLSAAEVAHDAGCQWSAVRRCIHALKTAGIVHIAGWEKAKLTNGGPWVAQYTVNVGAKDAPKPRPMTETEKTRRYRAARDMKGRQLAVLRALAGVCMEAA